MATVMAECSVNDGQNTQTVPRNAVDESKRSEEVSSTNHDETQRTDVVRRRSSSSNGEQNG